MKKSIMKVLYICSMFFLFNSCEQENEITTTETPKDGIATFHATISKTRTTGDLWDEGDAIGIYALKGGTTLSNGVFDEKSNIKYVTEVGDGYFKPASTEIMLPSTGTYDFVAYYPYQSNMTNNIYQIDISNQAKQSDIDLLYSNNAKGHTYTNPNASLKFNHMLSMVTLNISVVDEVTSLEGITAEITDVSTKGTFDISTVDIAIQEDTKGTITPIINGNNNSTTVSAILIPGQDFSNTKIVMNISGNYLEWKPNIKVLESGNNYQFSIKVTTQGTLEVGKAEIIGWNDVTINEDIDFVIKPGDDNSNNGGGNTGGEEGGEEPEVNPEPNGELLFEGADFEYANEKEFKASSLKSDSGYAKWKTITWINNGTEESTKVLHLTNTPVLEHYAFIGQIDVNKIQDNHSKISFDIKGSTPQKIIISLLNYEYGKMSEEVKYILNNESIKRLVTHSTPTSIEDGINTNDKWEKVSLDIKNLPIATKNKRNGFGIILFPTTSDLDLYIDNITIE